jgi:putative effector of murein hydrolase
MAGGIRSITTAVIILTGITASVLGPTLCKVFRLTDPIAQGAAFGTAGHVIGTAKATELDPLTGAVSSLSLVTAGLLTAIVLPLLTSFI